MDQENIHRESFSWRQTAELLTYARSRHELTLDPWEKSFVAVNTAGDVRYRFVPPLVQPIGAARSVDDYLDSHSAELGSKLVLLIQAGAAALGIWHNGEPRLHKVISKYVTRRKRGKAQLTYLNSKGKSRAGSRLRLRNTLSFFADISNKLGKWSEEIEHCDCLFYSCPVRLWGELFRAKVTPPVARDDIRWVKVPLDVRIPNFKELCHVFHMLSHGTIQAVEK